METAKQRPEVKTVHSMGQTEGRGMQMRATITGDRIVEDLFDNITGDWIVEDLSDNCIYAEQGGMPSESLDDFKLWRNII